MSFVLDLSDTYTWPVTLYIPVAGRKEKHTFDGEFRRLPQTRINEIVRLARRMEMRLAEDGEELVDQDAAREVLAGWSGVVDKDGKEIPFSDKQLGRMLELPRVAAQIVLAWFDSIEVAKKKN